MSFFNGIIKKLPSANIDIYGGSIHISQGKSHQVVFMEFDEEVNIPEHTHSDQVEFVIKGKVEVLINGKKRIYSIGDKFFIPDGVPHSAKVFAGYAAIAFFNERERFSIR